MSTCIKNYYPEYGFSVIKAGTKVKLEFDPRPYHSVVRILNEQGRIIGIILDVSITQYFN